MNTLEIIAIAYAVSVSLFLISGAVVLLIGQNDYDRKMGARQIFISPFAPIALIILAAMGVYKLWRVADFKGKEQR